MQEHFPLVFNTTLYGLSSGCHFCEVFLWILDMSTVDLGTFGVGDKREAISMPNCNEEVAVLEKFVAQREASSNDAMVGIEAQVYDKPLRWK